MKTRSMLHKRNTLLGALAVLLGLVAAVIPLRVSAAFAGPTLPPSAVTSLTVNTTPVATTVNVTWTPATNGAPLTGYMIWLQDDAGALSLPSSCGASCRSRLFPGLAPGRSYRALLAPFNSAGWGTSSTSSWLQVVSGCAGAQALCVTVDATREQGAAVQRAQGFLSATSRVWYGMTDLRPQWWRVHSADGNYQDFDLATSTGAQTVLAMSDAWSANAADAGRGGVVAPWENLPRYRQWVHDYVTSFVQSGRHPAYWEVMNEPGFENFLNETGTTGSTPARVLEQFRIAYGEIKAVDPSAKIVGPSFQRYFSYPGEPGPNMLDMKTFLDFANANNVRPAALVWHEIEVNWASNDPTVLPIQITEHVADARALLAERGMSDVKILIDEYGAPATYALPGWTVGYLAALEAANVDGAMRSCWPAQSLLGGTYNQCDQGLNGLYAQDNRTPLATYWVHAAYAAMKGNRITATPSTARLSALATQDTSGVVRALIGRNESCTPFILRDCRGGTAATPIPTPVTINVVVASTVKAARVQIARIGLWDSAGPAVTSDVFATVTNGQLSVSLPLVNNGDSYSLTVTPTL